MHQTMGEFGLGNRAMRYSQFVPKLYNYCLSLGFQRARMMPSRAFCSDESQGYPVIVIAQHFGTFPFDHGRVGGKVATDRHGPHAHHGEDLIIIQASHVGYDPVSGRFGVYRRERTAAQNLGDNCGKLCVVLQWYQHEYRNARENIRLGTVENRPAIFIDNYFLDQERGEGLFLHLDRLIAQDASGPLKILSTSKAFAPAPALAGKLPDSVWSGGPHSIGDWLTADIFSFRRIPVAGPEGHDLLEASLAPVMPALVTSAQPALDAARYHTQVEFDRTYRSIQREPAYQNKNVLFIAGLNIDISPAQAMPFPLTKFVPWAAYCQRSGAPSFLLEQEELIEVLRQQPAANPDQMSFDAAILAMAEAEGVQLPG